MQTNPPEAKSFIKESPTSQVAWFAVVSSNLAEYRYNPRTQDFDVKFKGNVQAYRYQGISLETANEFVECKPEGTTYTKGQYFSHFIKKPEFIKLTPEEAR